MLPANQTQGPRLSDPLVCETSGKKLLPSTILSVLSRSSVSVPKFHRMESQGWPLHCRPHEMSHNGAA